jgi:uncharacterized protein YdbL (DUF1318 family)
MKKLFVAGLMAATLLAGGAMTLHLSGYNVAEAQQASAASKQIVEAAKKRGEIGERIDGYLAAVTPLSADVQAAMNDINISRKVVYEKLAEARGQSIRVVAQLTGESQMNKAEPGEYIQGADGQWRQK